MTKWVDLQRKAAMARRAVSITAITVMGLIAAEHLSPFAMHAIRTQQWDLLALGAGLVNILPAAAFTAALWALRGAFASAAQGRPFTEDTPASLHAAGRALLIGAVAAVVVVPASLTLLGRGPGYLVALDAGAIAIGAVGIGLIAMAAMLREAAAMKSELDGFM
jgi:hypothetical protein